ncbi:MAG: GTP 3',8-cyclase MoaA [Clostridiales bacterium]|nr:GTP 3',8-cyclase MoaA [Clostridiales bacterium]
MKDRYGRNIDYMRLSVTDRCNLSCDYCSAGKKDTGTNPLSKDQILAIASAASSAGITKFKLTGGEPLMRSDLPEIIKSIKSLPGVVSVTLTTNGVLLSDKCEELKDAGIDLINVSIDTCDKKEYQTLTGSDKLTKVIEGIRACIANGIRVRINTVNRGSKTDVISLVKFADSLDVDLRFIELMPIGKARDMKGSPNLDIMKTLENEFGTGTEDEAKGNGPARYFSFPKLKIRVGFISALGEGFCDECNRLRVTSDGKLKPCLCFGDVIDLNGALKLEAGTREEALVKLIKEAVDSKPERHTFGTPDGITETRGMDYIGG